MRKLTIYRDDSTTQVVYDNVKHYFWTAGNTILSIAQYTNVATGVHKYIHWPRERICWFKDEPSFGKEELEHNTIILKDPNVPEHAEETPKNFHPTDFPTL